MKTFEITFNGFHGLHSAVTLVTVSPALCAWVHWPVNYPEHAEAKFMDAERRRDVSIIQHCCENNSCILLLQRLLLPAHEYRDSSQHWNVSDHISFQMVEGTASSFTCIVIAPRGSRWDCGALLCKILLSHCRKMNPLPKTFTTLNSSVLCCD